MEVRYEQPFPNLECSNAPPAGPPIASCFALRNSMPKLGDEQTFARNDANVDVLLPYSLVSGIVIPCATLLFRIRLLTMVCNSGREMQSHH